MRIFTRLRTGFALARRSVRVLLDNPELAAFPVVAAIAGLLYLAALGGVVLGTGTAPSNQAQLYLVLFAFYVGSTFVASFCTAALMFCTRQAFRGENPRLADGFRAAARNWTPLLAWAVISAVVGLVIRTLEDSNSIVAEVAGALFGVAWSILTYFVVPVVVFEDVGVVEMFARSKETVTQTWGESLGAAGGVGLVTVALVLLGVLVGLALFVALPGGFSLAGVLVVLAVALLGGLVGQTLTGIAKTALYVYATEDEAPHYFEGIDFHAGGGSEGVTPVGRARNGGVV